jgi:hypothetical protein
VQWDGGDDDGDVDADGGGCVHGNGSSGGTTPTGTVAAVSALTVPVEVATFPGDAELGARGARDQSRTAAAAAAAAASASAAAAAAAAAGTTTATTARPTPTAPPRLVCLPNTFLAPFDMKLLLEQHGGVTVEGLGRLPLTFSTRLASSSHLPSDHQHRSSSSSSATKLTPALRKRHTVLRHLPIGADVVLCDTEVWHHPRLVSDAVRARFKRERVARLRERASELERQRRDELLLAQRGAAELAAALEEQQRAL